MNSTENTKSIETEQQLSEIRQKIASLTEIEGIELRTEMASLKQALLENPEASALLLPEEVGACVDAIRKLLGASIVAATKEKKPAKAKPLSADMFKKLLDEVSEDDF